MLLRGQLASLVTAAKEAKSPRKAGPWALRIAGDAPVAAVADALAGWDIPRERLLEALWRTLTELEG